MLRPTAMLLAALVFVASPIGHGSGLESCTIAIDVGHTRASQGAVSARGVGEHAFNEIAASALLEELRHGGDRASFIIDGTASRSFDSRAEAAVRGKADLLVSIHHDSVQPRYLDTWNYKGKPHRYSDRFAGYSLFYSGKNARPRESLRLATALGDSLIASGFHPTLHHAEAIPGEHRELVDRKLGVYRFDDLILLKHSSIPAVLVEGGIVVNRDEEQRLTDPRYRRGLVLAIAKGLRRFCETRVSAR
jgi:N-acetylmuramoyl-L-alanine amidase